MGTGLDGGDYLVLSLYTKIFIGKRYSKLPIKWEPSGPKVSGENCQKKNREKYPSIWNNICPMENYLLAPSFIIPTLVNVDTSSAILIWYITRRTDANVRSYVIQTLLACLRVCTYEQMIILRMIQQ